MVKFADDFLTQNLLKQMQASHESLEKDSQDSDE